ncbi:hypothetical protein QTG54_007277 [Skeletonema marinoi]|uniref:Uncharacterized protein n=1 Tax=Skeletonema marinoi TaxID=267567 RepID=A0AAD9DD81_9STRA|nr:hypothetical protein QTG54_007277 [Skeletonema marinoi]
MKFSLIALAGAVASANASVKNIKLGNRKLRRGDVTEALLKNAVPFKTRRLDGADEANEVDGSYSISFGKCIDIKTKSDDLFDENVIEQVQNGNALSLKSYILFYACQDAYGYGCSEDDSDVYMVDLPTYLSVVGTKQVYKRNDYCEQCEQNQDTCAADNDAYEAADENENDDAQNQAEEEEEVEEEEDYDEEQMEAEEAEEENDEQMEEEEDEDNEQVEEEEDEDNEDQMGEDQDEDNEDQMEEEGDARKLKQQIDCNRCDALQCFDKYSNDDAVVSQAATREEIDTYVGEWIEEVANCKATNEYLNGQPVYIGPICSDYADTFEIGAFLDEDCTIYTKLASYANIVAAEEANYSVDVAGYAISTLKTAFYEPMICESQEFAEGDEEEEDEYEMNDYCKQLFEQDAINFNECAADEEEEQQDEGDDAYNWYSYDVEDADEVEKVCAKIVSFNGVYSNYYDSASSGSVQTRDSRGNLTSSQSTTGLSVGAIVAIALACVVVVGVAARLLKPRKVKAPALHEPVYDGNRLS